MMVNRIMVVPLLVCVSTTAGPPSSASWGQSPAAQQSAARATPPSWVTRPPADDAQNYSFVGTATSASAAQARDRAYENAVRKAVVRIGTRLFEDPSVTTWYSIDALREYVRKVGRTAPPYTRSSPGSYTTYWLLQLNRGFVEPSAVRRYVSAVPASPQQQAPTAVGYLLVPSNVGPAGVTKRTQVRMPNPRQGNFYLFFSLAGSKGQVWIRLNQIQVFDDGSAGTTRWTFDVRVNGRQVITTPITAYSDDVTTYRTRAGDRTVEAQIKPADGLNEIMIVGTRTSAASAK